MKYVDAKVVINNNENLSYTSAIKLKQTLKIIIKKGCRTLNKCTATGLMYCSCQ